MDKWNHKNKRDKLLKLLLFWFRYHIIGLFMRGVNKNLLSLLLDIFKIYFYAFRSTTCDFKYRVFCFIFKKWAIINFQGESIKCSSGLYTIKCLFLNDRKVFWSLRLFFFIDLQFFFWVIWTFLHFVSSILVVSFRENTSIKIYCFQAL